MLFITQLIYIREGQENIFHQFEDFVIPVISKYKGQLLLRIRPADNTFIQCSIEKPYEIHLVAFDSEKDFQAFTKDEQRKQFLNLKDESIKSVLLIKGTTV